MLWRPSEETIANANLTSYTRWLAQNKQLSFSDYHQLWTWSVKNIDEFWGSLWQYFDILHDGTYQTVEYGKEMYKTSWFEGTHLNYAEHIFRKQNDVNPAIIFKNERGDIKEISWQKLRVSVASLHHYLKDNNISKGDSIVAFIPCIPEATIAMLATVSLGATWSSCSPDFGTQAVIERFSQVSPKVLITIDNYTYGGKSFDKSQVVRDLVKHLPSLEQIILISDRQGLKVAEKNITAWDEVVRETSRDLEFVRVPFAQPLWILYSSGTTGLDRKSVV